MVDSVQASKFITEKKTYSLIKKLEKLCSKYEAQSIQGQVYLTNRIKSMNQSIYYNTNEIHSAISNGKQISFQYLTYTITKDEAFRRGGTRYQVSPFALIYAEENYYLLAFDSKTQIFKHYRVDRMKDISFTSQPREGEEAFKKIDLKTYTKRVFSMFGGKQKLVTIRFINPLLDAVVDRFGTTDFQYAKVDDTHFSVSGYVEISDQFFGWLLGFGNKAKLLYPDDTIQELSDYLDKIRSLY